MPLKHFQGNYVGRGIIMQGKCFDQPCTEFLFKQKIKDLDIRAENDRNSIKS